MSKVVLKRSLFIGLGGTGATALLHTKKRFLDTYGEVPPMIDFLVIDTDLNTNTKTLERENVLPEIHKDTSHTVGFQQSEILLSQVQGAVEAYRINKDTLFSWMPEENEHVLKDMVHGAGQVRTNGRYSIYFNQSKIISAVKSKINDITHISISDDGRFEPKGSGIEINFVFSIAGGTGSGSFLDVAYLVKDALAGNDEITTIGFLVLPDVFNAMQHGITMENTKPNSYGALMDLDYFMRNDIEKMGVNIVFENRTLALNSNPFDILFTVNNKNTSGDTISHIRDISEQIGLAMFTGASELSAHVGSVYDNVKSVLAGGALDIENKRAWACGMGVSELFYDGNTLGNIYARRVIVEMIANLLNTNENAQKLADSFIDDPNVNIRENNGDDHLIDSLLNPNPNNQFSGLQELSEMGNEIKAFLNTIDSTAKGTIDSNYNVKLANVQSSLQNEINTIINDNFGVGNTKAFLNDLTNQLDIFNAEMKSEEEEFKKTIKQIDEQIEATIKHIQSVSKGVSAILRKGDIRMEKENLSDMTNKQATNIHELYRRDYAQKFISTLIKDVANHLTNVKTVEQRLQNVKNSSTGEANRMANSASTRKKTFVIDLHKADLDKTYSSGEDFILSDLIKTLNLENNIYDFYESSVNSITNYFWKYTKQLPTAIGFRNKSIDDVFLSFSDDKKAEIAKQLMSKSLALWQWSSKGYKVAPDIFNYFVIGLPSMDSKFKNAFDGFNQAGQTAMEFVNTGVRNKITCYRMEAAVPIFGVQGVVEYETEYKHKTSRKGNINYHIDNNWLTKMNRENFSIWPDKKEDNSLSIWVFGFVYDFIRLNDDGKYEIYSLEQGDPINDFWTDLSKYRDEAFDLFKSGKFAEELEELIKEKQSAQGEDKTIELMGKVKSDYRKLFAKINISDTELNTNPYKKVRDLLASEIIFTKKGI